MMDSPRSGRVPTIGAHVDACQPPLSGITHHEKVTERSIEHIRKAAGATAGPLAGLLAVYGLAVLNPWGRRLDSLSWHGRFGAGWSLRAADLFVLEAISVASLALVLSGLVVLGGLRGNWGLGLRHTGAVVGALVSAEALKLVLPGTTLWSGQWRPWPSGGSFPSGHSVIVTSIALALLSISTDTWRRRLVGPLLAATAVATTATVTVGWHRPSDVVASLFLATAWHRAVSVSQSDERPLRTMLTSLTRSARSVPGALWWAVTCVIVLGAAAPGVSAGLGRGYLAPLVYLVSLAVVLAGVLLTVALTPARPPSSRP